VTISETTLPYLRLKQSVWHMQRLFERTLDPIGMMTPILHAQAAWALHPQEWIERVGRFSADLWTLQQHCLARSLGATSPDPIPPNPDDVRFLDPVWTESASWDITKEYYLAFTHHIQDALYETPGLSEKERRQAAFWWRKWLNALAPTNFLWTNPVAMQKAFETGGKSLIDGFENFLNDAKVGNIRMTDLESFQVGRDLAATPGQVVFRNHLLEVIRYTPLQPKVHAEPVVIITPWINKFYILDLNPKKSLVRYLLDQGLDVFITSWNNPDEQMRDVPFDAYLEQGIHVMVETARSLTDAKKVHAVGYCIGGTALAMYMAWANRRFEPEQVPVADFTLFTTLVDFENPGDIEVFIDQGAVDYLIDSMERKGYLDGSEMASAFRILRSNSLIWHYVVHGWLYGEKPAPFDVLYWNMDTTRMPCAMHSWYLRELYLHNRLIQPDSLYLAGEPINLGHITQPLYAVGAEDDHIAPWQQTFKVHEHVSGPCRYVLSSSGHILGIINPPVKPPKRQFRANEPEHHENAEQWLARNEPIRGSWWEDWMAWLKPRCGPLVAPKNEPHPDFPPLCEAPGTYVLKS
jgi:polyhydroxyalkanoate synthase subunit PhaC